MKIVLIIPHLGKGGAESLIVDHANRLADHCMNLEIEILCLFNLIEAEFNLSRLHPSIKVHFIFKRKIKFLSVSSKIFRIICLAFFPFISVYAFVKFRMYRFDVIHSNLTYANILQIPVYLLSKTGGLKQRFVITFHTNLHLVGKSVALINYISWLFTDVVVFEIFEKDSLEIRLPRSSVQKLFIPFGYVCSTERAFSRHKGGIVRICTISRLRIQEKRILEMIEVAGYLKASGLDVIFDIYGDGEDRDLVKEFIETKEGFSEFVHLKGFVDDPETIYSHYHFAFIATVGGETGISGMNALCSGSIPIGFETLTIPFLRTETSIRSFKSNKEVFNFSRNLLLETDLLAEYISELKYIREINHLRAEVFTERYIEVYRT